MNARLLRLLAAGLLLAGGARADGWSLQKMSQEYGQDRAADWLVQAAGPATSHQPLAWGGLAQYFGAGGSSPEDAFEDGDGVAERFQALFPGLDNLSAGQAGSGSAELSESERDQLLSDVVAKLAASCVLRDNVVTVFGYFVNRPATTLSPGLYSSLYHLYNLARYRRLQTAELVGFLKEMSTASPNNQFKIIFREMKKVVPRYLESAVDEWIKAINSKSVNVNAIMRPKGAPLVVDFLQGIKPSVFPTLTKKLQFPEEITDRAPKETKELLGPLLANTLVAVARGTLPLTQKLFALILQHRTSNYMVPQWVETERYISDVLRMEKVKNWDEIVQRAEKKGVDGTFSIGTNVLWEISEGKDVDRSLQEAARLVLTYVKKPVPTYANPDYNHTSLIMSKPAIDVVRILKAITPLEYPEDVVDAMNRVRYYILAGFLDMESVIKGFNRFDHANPINLVIAILTRVERRMSKLPQEIISSVKYLKIYLVFKKFLSSMSPQIPRDFLESPFLLDSFAGPSTPKKIQKLVKNVAEYLRHERLPVEELVKKVPVEECSRPRQCILNIYRRVIKRGYFKGHSVEKLMINLVKNLDFMGNPLTAGKAPEFDIYPNRRRRCWRKNKKQALIELLSSTSSSSTSSSSTTTSTTTSTTSTTSTTTPAPMVTTTALPPEEFYDEPDPIYPGPPEEPIVFPIQHKPWDKPNYDRPETLLPLTELGSREDTKLRPIRVYLSSEDLYKLLGEKFHFKSYTSRSRLLLAILKKSQTLKHVQYDGILSTTISDYVNFLENLPKHPDIIYKSTFPRISPQFEYEPADFKEPVKNLPQSVTGTLQHEKLEPLKKMLSDVNLYYRLGPYFKPSMYETKGSYLRALFRHSLKLSFVRRNSVLYLTIKQFVDYLDEADIRPSEIRAAPFPPRDPIQDHEPANWHQVQTLLPATVAGTAVHVKMRPLKELFARPDFWQVMGPILQPELYETKGELLRALLAHAQTVEAVREDVALHALVQSYLQFVQKRGEAGAEGPAVALDTAALASALPPPESRAEEELARKVRQLLASERLREAVASNFSSAPQMTRGDALQKVLRLALGQQSRLAALNETIQAVAYYEDRVSYEGYGAQSAEYLLVEKQAEEKKFDAFNLFRAIDHDRLDSRGRQVVNRVLKFVTVDFEPKKYLPGFDHRRATTKSEFLKRVFQFMIGQEAVSDSLKRDMGFLLGYIKRTGPGAEAVEAKPPGDEEEEEEE